ncbi:tripartite tricarboxylate transporter substrate-binding protein [Paracidovorax avenae]
MCTDRRSFLLLSCAALSAVTAPALAAAPQRLGGRPVQIVVPYAAGGLTDNLARVIAPALSARWSLPVVVDNRNGGGGTIGTAAVARAPGDGHTLLLTAFGYVSNPLLMDSLPYEPHALAPLAMVGDTPSVLYVNARLPVTTVAELVAYGKAHPGKLVFASSGNGSSPHIAAELLAALTGIEIVHVPYRGNGPALNDLLGGQVQAMFDSVASLAHVRSGRLRALGVASAARLPRAPELVPIAQSGVPQLAGFAAGGWFGFIVPAATPPALQQWLHAELRQVLQEPAVGDAVERAGVEQRSMTQEAFAAYLEAERARWAPVFRQRGIRLD